MEKTIEIPEGYEARIEGDKVILERKESEDERIRKTLIYIVKGACDKYGIKYKEDNITEEKLLAYLERQKEQKPAEYEKPLLSKFEQAVYDCAWNKVTCKPEGETQEEYAKRWAQQFLSMIRDWADDYIDFQIESAKRKAYDKGKADNEKSAGWSEEDNEKIGRLRSIVNEYACRKGALDVNGDYCEGDYEKLDNWLKDLPNRFALQSKQEWSEEDLETIESIIQELKIIKGNQTDEELIADYEDKIKWMQRLKSLRPSWKPSEEQMEALMLAIEGKWDAIKPTGYMSRRLEDLYDGIVNTFGVECKLEE